METKKEQCHITNFAILLWIAVICVIIVTFTFSLFHQIGDKDMIKFLLEVLCVSAISMSGGSVIKAYGRYKATRNTFGNLNNAKNN